MSLPTLEQALERQAALGRHLQTLLRLSAMQAEINGSIAWHAVLDRKQQEIEALQALDLAGSLQAGRQVAAAAGAAAAPLAELLERNGALLVRLDELEAQARQRVDTILANYRSRMAAEQHGVRLRQVYGGRRLGPARFMNHVR